MLNILIKEINSFFGSVTGYVIVGVYLIITGLLVWIFPETAILNYGYANLEPLFITSPWVFLFLAPAITMRAFSEEKKTGTLEILFTKPVSEIKIILGKLLGSLILLITSVIPTLTYYLTVYWLGYTVGNIDSGATWGSYLGLLLMGSAYLSIGIFTSSLTENQVVAFILSVFCCFILFTGFDSLSSLHLFAKIDYYVQWLGINFHYKSISKGVIDTRDIIYFLSIDILFILMTKHVLNIKKE